jgi:hypothetical protein
MTLELVRPRETLKVQIWKLVRECNLFGDAFLLLNAPYAMQTPVSVDESRQFVLALKEKDVEVTKVNIGRLFLLCDEFGVFQESGDRRGGSAAVSNGGAHIPEEVREVEMRGLQPLLLFAPSGRHW